MSEHFINLNCANCGAKLAVYDDMERFSCSYCGTELIVQRRGGTVALKAVTEAIHKVQIGTDKTAAELAIVRLNKELDKQKAEYAGVQGLPSARAAALGCGVVVLVLLMLALLSQAGPGLGISGVVITLGVIVWALMQDAKNQEAVAQVG